jgi:hypothetical protein
VRLGCIRPKIRLLEIVDGKIVAQIAGISVEAVIDGAMSGQIAAPHRASTWGEIKARMPHLVRNLA